jgi:PAS domain S-box-containing protein
MKNFRTNSGLEFSKENPALNKKRDRSVDNLQCLTFTVSLDLTIVDVNEAAVNELGYDSKNQLMNQPLITTIYDPSTHEDLELLFQKLEEEQDLRYEEVTIISRDGKSKKVMLNVDTVLDRSGYPICRVFTHVAFLNSWVEKTSSVASANNAVVHSEKENQKKECCEQISLVEGIIEQSLFAISITDPTGTIIRTNKKFREYINLSSGEILGKINVFDDANLIENDVLPKVKSVFNELKPTRFNIFCSNPVIREKNQKGNTFVWLHVFAYPVMAETGQLKSVVFQWMNMGDPNNNEDEFGSEKDSKQNIHRKGHSIILY